jgi:pSer/pThr/pTyr-binding forkhead associated (FHA) protein
LGLGALGFAIGLMLQLAQQALKTAWLSGITTGPYEGKQYILGKPIVTVGRSDGNDIGLYREKTLALKAGTFAFNQGRWMYSGAAVEVNGSSTANATLTGGDTIQFGNTQFLFEERGANSSIPEPSNSSVPETPEVQNVPSSSPPNPNQTEVFQINQTTSQPVPRADKTPSMAIGWQLVAPDQNIALEIGKTLHLGRVTANDIVLTDSSVSSKHALLEVRSEAVYLTDLGSTNGTSVNKHLIQTNTKIMLHAGDQIAFGASIFSLQKIS